MAIEKKWLAVRATPLTANGTSTGIVTVADTAGFKTKQVAYLLSNTLKSEFQVQEVLSPTQLVLGPRGPKVGRQNFSDLSGYLLSNNAVIGAAEQDRAAKPTVDDHYQAIYESDPTVADRVVFVDQYGRFYDDGNPLPIAFDGTISIGKVVVAGDNGNTIEPNPDGSINVNIISAQTQNKTVNRYAEVNSVAAGVETTVVQYLVPLNLTSSILQRISVSGDNVGQYKVYLNGTTIDSRRTFFGGSFNEQFEFCVGTADGTTLSPGDTVAVKILHNSHYVGDFQGRIQVFEIV